MRLPIVDASSPVPAGVPDVVRALAYRPELFGEAFSNAIDALLRGPSSWSVGERGGREEVSAVAEGGPGRGEAHAAPPGRRISMASG